MTMRRRLHALSRKRQISTRLLQATLALTFGLTLQAPLQAATVDGEEVPLHHVSAEACKDCHKAIYKQWKGSMHAQSTALKDPIHGAFYKKLVGDPTKEGVTSKNGMYPVCLQCHAPNAALDKKTKLDALPAYSEGINCVSCHSMAKYKGIHGKKGKFQLGVAAYEFSDQLQGPNGFLHEQGAAADKLRAAIEDEGELNPHLGLDNSKQPYITAEEAADLNLPMQQNATLQSSDACLGCHDKRHNPKNTPLCQTGDEIAEGGSQETCQSCHMPVVNGVTSHAMGGGHDLGMLKRSVKMTLEANASGDNASAKVTIKNLQPHNVPTGAPFRNMVLKVTALDAKGNVLWQNYQKHPAKEDPQAFFVYTMTDDSGQPAPPPQATQVGKNTRLKPFEERVLSYDFTVKGRVDSVRAELFYNLLWPGLVKQMKALPDELKAPKRIAWSEARL
ncbi:MAG: cytochrome c family protein [Chromatiales bacterium]|nr:cytochrome c family protein [Chromatiales bacterium]